jgi:hypothetical protein
MSAPPPKPMTKATNKPPVKHPPRPLVPADQAVVKAWRTMMACVVLTAAVAAFVISSNRTDIILKTDAEGQVRPLQSMSTPNLGSDAVISWAKIAVSEIFTYNFNNVVDRMTRASRYFTPEGWSGFVNSAKEHGLIDNVVKQRQFVTTVPVTAVISSEYDEKNRYYWIVEIATLTDVYTGQNSVSKGGMTLKIAQIPTEDSLAGYAFGITQITR